MYRREIYLSSCYINMKVGALNNSSIKNAPITFIMSGVSFSFVVMMSGLNKTINIAVMKLIIIHLLIANNVVIIFFLL